MRLANTTKEAPRVVTSMGHLMPWDEGGEDGGANRKGGPLKPVVDRFDSASNSFSNSLNHLMDFIDVEEVEYGEVDPV